MPSDTFGIFLFRKFLSLVFPMIVLNFLLVLCPAEAEMKETEIIGMPEVIDPDILKFGQQRVILWGIDAPERPQICKMNGAIWGCYDVAKRHLQLLAGRGEVRCVLRGKPDPFGRRFGVCKSGGQELNAEMVRAGLALAFEEQSAIYIPQMVEAITNGVGLWQVGVKFEEPWLFRRRENPGGYR